MSGQMRRVRISATAAKDWPDLDGRVGIVLVAGRRASDVRFGGEHFTIPNVDLVRVPPRKRADGGKAPGPGRVATSPEDGSKSRTAKGTRGAAAKPKVAVKPPKSKKSKAAFKPSKSKKSRAQLVRRRAEAGKCIACGRGFRGKTNRSPELGVAENGRPIHRHNDCSRGVSVRMVSGGAVESNRRRH
jgi:hypothetical protein